jgi:hypothetical protein
MSEYDPAELKKLLIRCSRVLGLETYERVAGQWPGVGGEFSALVSLRQ